MLRRTLPRPFHLLALSAVLLALLARPAPALAVEIRNDTSGGVPSGQTVDDDLIAGGQTVAIAGRVTGDAYAGGQTVVVSGTVDGDLIAAAEEVTIDGTVQGDVRAAGARVTVNGQVGKNVTAAGQRVMLGTNGRVGGSILAAAETLSAFGPIGRGATFAASTAQLAGPIGGNVLARVGSLSIAPTARITGALDYHAEQQASVPSGSVGGQVTFTQVERREEKPPKPVLLNGLLDLGGLIWLFGSAILGAIAIRLFPTTADRLVQLGRQEPLPSFAVGLATLILTPVAALLAAVTLIGLPLTTVVFLLYGLGLLLAWPALGLVVGALLVRAIRRPEPIHPVLMLLIGLIALHLLTHVPVIGPPITFLGLSLGLGLLVYLAARRPRSMDRAILPAAA